MLGAKENRKQFVFPPPPHPYAAGLPPWVGPAGGDLLVLKTIEKRNWLFYKTIGKGTIIFDIGIPSFRVTPSARKKSVRGYGKFCIALQG